MIRIRKARTADAPFIHRLLAKYAKKADLVVRPASEIVMQIRDYIILEYEGKKSGMIALHVYGNDLAEIRSFVIESKARSKGYGRELVAAAFAEAAELGVKKVFALTAIPKFFRKHGFRPISKQKLPQKIWKDCLACPKFPDECGEKAFIHYIKD